MQLKLVEPLKWLFKDKVREMGKLLGVPASFVSRHPFPGPGLAVRIMGDVCQENALETIRLVASCTIAVHSLMGGSSHKSSPSRRYSCFFIPKIQILDGRCHFENSWLFEST